MDLDESAQRFRFLVRDRDATFTDAFNAVFGAASIIVLRTPPQSRRAKRLRRAVASAASAPTGY
ncbi:hypothetical protein [Actinomadura sp. WMMA1423]|uniref:hypothetical protein n=1 Tax=Actinomadura sp. WMMA1423 TaxID=2591108 RepID=UPI00197AE8B1|nr:hypothetical protein [Actinomadura sp. WMMA1423]